MFSEAEICPLSRHSGSDTHLRPSLLWWCIWTIFQLEFWLSLRGGSVLTFYLSCNQQQEVLCHFILALQNSYFACEALAWQLRCSRLNKSPPPPTRPWNLWNLWNLSLCSFSWQRDVADVIRVLRWGDCPGLCGGLDVTTRVLARQMYARGVRVGERRSCDDGNRSGNDMLWRWRRGPQVKEYKCPLRARWQRKEILV